ncbi:MAG: hypothetical protein NTY09_14000 [bacterium]|nr:hypothetical protein [bacterium]
MDIENKNDAEKVVRIQEIYKTLSEDGKNHFIHQILENEDIMGRLLDKLLEVNDQNQGAFESDSSSFISFLRKAKE